ncbi:SAGA-associated factor 73 [Entomortierella parvispora]|uniref:SAGA-associated factor 73 n=1 Tax=Entomortierella parvispora TaxID=205924 RepID=A0A9P3H127_9FUNG|nr:SAGA-associated factor 73 [Entomortierella parvispora]
MNGTPPAGWEALNEKQTGLLMEQRREIELAEAGILNNAQSLLGPDTVSSLSELVNPQTISVFRDQDRWKKLPRSSTTPVTPVNNDLLRSSTSWTGIRSQLDAEECYGLSERITSPPVPRTPTSSRLESKEMKTYGGLPLSDDIVVLTCNSCDKPIIPSAFKEHRLKCKAAPAAETPAEPPLAIRTDNLEKKLDAPKSKKRKTSVVLEEPETPVSAVEMSPPPSSTTEKKPLDKKQKVAKPPKVKPAARVKGPLDLDKQCGVIMVPGNTPCARSLTCKSHSMSSKRSVEGRSRPYDVLLSLVQKKPVSVKDEKSGRLESEAPLAEKEDVNVDSDEEFNDLLDAVKSYEPQPLASRPMTYMRRRNNCLRIRDLFFDALKGPCRPILPSGSTHEKSSMHL